MEVLEASARFETLLPRISPTDFLLSKCHNRLLILHVCHILLSPGRRNAGCGFLCGGTYYVV